MGQLSPILRNGRSESGQLMLSFWCPGCDEVHAVRIVEDGKPGWSWNESADKPTFQPSIAVSCGCKTPGFNPDEQGCWCTFNAERVANGEEPCAFSCSMCHSYVTDGRIQFLGDCTHHLVGQTVDLPAWSEGIRNDNQSLWHRKESAMTDTIQHENGKADVIADGPGTARQVPAGDGEKEAGKTAADVAAGGEAKGGWINGKPATKEQVEKSTEQKPAS